MHARARKRQKRAQLFISLRMSIFGAYVRVRARIIMKINMVVNMHTDSLSFKFYEDPFFGCREIAEINMSMDYSHF